MELGARVCTPREPKCEACPARDVCKAHAAGIAEELPRTTPKAAPKTSAMRAFVIDVGDAIVCGKRPPEALYGGMWEPPTSETRSRLVCGLPVASFERRGRFVHVLTHRRFEVEVLYRRARKGLVVGRLEPYERLELVPKGDLARLAMSRLARRILVISSSTP
jgi:A/G-specific adenine glycosylase